MRLPFLDIAIFLLIFNTCVVGFDQVTTTPITVMNQTGQYLWGGNGTSQINGFTNDTDIWWVDPLNVTEKYNNSTFNVTGNWFIDGVYGSVSYFFASVAGGLQWAINGLNFLKNIFIGCFAAGSYLKYLVPSIPDHFVWIINAAVDAVYILGVIQWLTNRQMR